MLKNDLIFIPVTTNEDIDEISKLAYEIWSEHYSYILGPPQVEYMLRNFQSPESISNQIQFHSYQYYFLNFNDTNVGYFAIQSDNSKLFLSKIYIKKDYRNRGIAKSTISFLENICKMKNLNCIWLTVNKDNNSSIDAYKKMDFVITNTLVSAIGNGYYMDDYLMERKCC